MKRTMASSGENLRRQALHQAVIEILAEKQKNPIELVALCVDAHSIQGSRFYADYGRDGGLFRDQHSAF